MKRTTMQLTGMVLLALVAACAPASNKLTNNPNDPNANNGLHIEIVGSTRAVLAPQRQLSVVARLLLGTQPVPGAQLNMIIQGAAAGSYLSKATDVTNEVGEISFTLTAGPSPTQLQIVVTADNAEPARLDVSIDGKYAGNLVVRANGSQLPSDLKIAYLNVKLHDGRGAACSSLNLDDAPAGLPAIVQSTNVAGLNLDARFNGLTQDTSYIATVVALNQVGRAVAVGCGGPSTVAAERDTYINVDMRLADPSIVGKYEYAMDITPLEFMDHNQTYATVSNILNLLQDVGGTILLHWLVYDSTTNTVSEKGLCSGASGGLSALCAVGAAVFEPLLEALLSIDSSGTALLVERGIHDAAAAIQRLHVGGTLEIKTHDRTTGDITATLGFDTYNFIWRAQSNCNPKDNPDACCGHYVFDAANLTSSPTETTSAPQMNSVFQPFIKVCGNAPSGNFSAACPDVPGKVTKVQGATPQQVTYNLNIPPVDGDLANGASLSLAYGSVVLGVIEGLVLPNVLDKTKFPGETINGTRIVKLGDMLRGLINCDNISDSSTRALCQGGAAAIDALFDQFIGALAFNGTDTYNLRMKVAGQFLDTDQDLAVDTMAGNVSIIAVVAGGAPRTAVSNSVQALYNGINCISDNSCQNGMACRFAKNPLDNCFAKPYCGVPGGVHKGGDSCFLDTDCFSGSCIKAYAGYTVTNTNRCYQACKQDSDCPPTDSCDSTGMVVVQEDGVTSGPNDVITRTGTCVPRSLRGPTGPT